ncbi:SMODS domain-containing nucleotidyltransferase [Neobacillus sp. YIM B06451]|uniref:SMODS domain-containing nucleotidyltransferase n=1 Tax=Neobacillus sp. YIM B06451 TaxID=3070994 RepID=UPI00292F0715|nr:nucleotidyltransferase [Neobacillus sp. YIM B06451]
MKLNDHFKKFVANISLNPTRKSRIESALSHWEDNFKDDVELKDLFLDFYTQGSYSTHTGIKPKSGGDFDVDAILKLDLDESEDPKETLKWIGERVISHKEFEDRVNVKDRCVRIQYAEGFHVDIVPSIPFEEIIKIPSKKENEWCKTNPAGFTSWCNDINNSSDKYFGKIVKIMKHWQGEKVGEDTAPKSILLTTLIGNSFVKKSSIAESLVETLNSLIDELEILVDDEEIFVENPSLEDENLARNWDTEKAKRFLKKVKKLKEDAEDAMNDTDKDSSIEKWQDIFGKSYFPSELGEAKDMADKIKQGAVKVSSIGLLNTEQGTKLRDHRFYGEK